MLAKYQSLAAECVCVLVRNIKTGKIAVSMFLNGVHELGNFTVIGRRLNCVCERTH